MVNYSDGKIYELRCKTTGEVYIGSTCCQYLSQRLRGHVEKFRAWQEGKRRHCTAFSIIGRGNYEIILLESYSCKTKDELRAREGYYQRRNQCVNKRIECHTIQEWKDENKDKLKATKDKYRSIKFKCECGSEVNRDGRNRHLRSKQHEKNIFYGY